MKCLHDTYIITAEDTAGFLECGCPVLSITVICEDCGITGRFTRNTCQCEEEIEWEDYP
jgi:hypothetical protein|tara:strand:+ start:557 stop:733 length:177 start_codon:yes stop_codon:yes gene_type:complete